MMKLSFIIKREKKCKLKRRDQKWMENLWGKIYGQVENKRTTFHGPNKQRLFFFHFQISRFIFLYFNNINILFLFLKILYFIFYVP